MESRDREKGVVIGGLADQPIPSAGFTPHTEKILYRAGLRVMGDLANLTEPEIRALPRVGRRRFSEIVEVLSEHGLTYRSRHFVTYRRRR